MTLCSLLFDVIPNSYQKTLDKLIELIEQAPKDSLIVAPEVAISGFDYENYEELLEFSNVITNKLKSASYGKIVVTTMIQRSGSEIFNFAKVFYNGEVVFQRAKARLFRFGKEHEYMSEGSDSDIVILDIDGIKLGILICFELRFKSFWQKLEGCDVIAVPSWWGSSRSQNFLSLTNALAILNQCYVVASDSLNESCTKLSGIIDPFGVDERNKDKEILMKKLDYKQIELMRRYMDVGIR